MVPLLLLLELFGPLSLTLQAGGVAGGGGGSIKVEKASGYFWCNTLVHVSWNPPFGCGWPMVIHVWHNMSTACLFGVGRLVWCARSSQRPCHVNKTVHQEPHFEVCITRESVFNQFPSGPLCGSISNQKCQPYYLSTFMAQPTHPPTHHQHPLLAEPG